MTYEELQAVNAEIKTTNIKGKEYAEVPQRVNAFRKLYPEGFITTSIISLEGEVCVMHATAGYYQDGEMIILGTGTAYEKEGNGFINQTSYIENCETSAVGRALGFVGIGSDRSIASAEEVGNAVKQQDDIKKITAKEAMALDSMLSDKQKKYVFDKYGITDLKELNKKQYVTLLNTIEAQENGR